MKQTIIKKALKVMESEFIAGVGAYNDSSLVKDYCRLQLGAEKEEVFAVMFLNTHLELLSFEKIFRGTINESSVSARAIARRMFELNAAKMIFAHNHPSGNVTPSAADKILTTEFKNLFKMLDCIVIDHIIVSPLNAISLAENGDL